MITILTLQDTKQHARDLLPIFSELERYYFGDDAATQAQLYDYLCERVLSEYSGVKVAVYYRDGVIVGFATFSLLFPAPKLSGQMFMKDLFVSSAVRGQGIGQQLLRFLAQFALDHGCLRLDWTAESTNPTTGAFYRSLGAKQVTEKQYFRFEHDQLRLFAHG